MCVHAAVEALRHELPAIKSLARRQEANIANPRHPEHGGRRVRVYYRDRCCDGRNNPSEAVFFQIFCELLGVKGDFWHRLHGLTQGLDHGEPGIVSGILSLVSKATFDKHGADLRDVGELLKRCTAPPIYPPAIIFAYARANFAAPSAFICTGARREARTGSR